MAEEGRTEEAQWRGGGESAGFLLPPPSVAFVVIHWWLWEPPSPCKSASQVCAAKRSSLFFSVRLAPPQSGAKGQRRINAGVTLTFNPLIKSRYLYINIS